MRAAAPPPILPTFRAMVQAASLTTPFGIYSGDMPDIVLAASRRCRVTPDEVRKALAEGWVSNG